MLCYGSADTMILLLPALYFMGIMAMTSASVMTTITALALHHRSPETHKMPKSVSTSTNTTTSTSIGASKPILVHNLGYLLTLEGFFVTDEGLCGRVVGLDTENEEARPRASS